MAKYSKTYAEAALRVQEEIWAGRSGQWWGLPPQLRCNRCGGYGVEQWHGRDNNKRCDQCQGHGIPAIPFSEVSNEQSR
jgi:DnaJ-class molecular chaperone